MWSTQARTEAAPSFERLTAAMRNALHTLVSILMWILFVYYWYLVVSRQINIASFQAIGTLALLTLVILLLTVWWIAHNKALASQNRRRQPPPPVPEWFEKDHLGQKLVSPGLEVLRATASIVVSVDEEGRKIYAIVNGADD